MKTIIKITKQEAIEAWKMMNSHIAVGEDTTVEIDQEYNTLIGTGTTIIGSPCILCGKQGGANTIHNCISNRGFAVPC